MITEDNINNKSEEEKSFKIRVSDLNNGCFLEVTPSTKITEIKDLAFSKNISCEKLSYNGEELLDATTLSSHNIIYTGSVLLSRLTLIFHDISLNIEEKVVCYGSDTILCATEKYFAQSNRASRSSFSLSWNGKELDIHSKIGLLGLENEASLTFRANPFWITLQDTSSLVLQDIPDIPGASIRSIEGNIGMAEVQIEDGWNLFHLREILGRISGKDLEMEYFFSWNGRRLIDNVAFYRYGIRDNDLVIINRNEENIACEYLCSNCGKDVWLKKRDMVVCKNCFGRVLYKKRKKRSFPL